MQSMSRREDMICWVVLKFQSDAPGTPSHPNPRAQARRARTTSSSPRWCVPTTQQHPTVKPFSLFPQFLDIGACILMYCLQVSYLHYFTIVYTKPHSHYSGVCSSCQSPGRDICPDGYWQLPVWGGVGNSCPLCAVGVNFCWF